MCGWFVLVWALGFCYRGSRVRSVAFVCRSGTLVEVREDKKLRAEVQPQERSFTVDMSASLPHALPAAASPTTPRAILPRRR